MARTVFTRCGYRWWSSQRRTGLLSYPLFPYGSLKDEPILLLRSNLNNFYDLTPSELLIEVRHDFERNVLNFVCYALTPAFFQEFYGRSAVGLFSVEE